MQGDLDDDLGDTARVILKRVKSNVEVRHSARMPLRLPAPAQLCSANQQRQRDQLAAKQALGGSQLAARERSRQVFASTTL